MSESFHSSEVEPRARWLIDLEPTRLHAWMLRAASRQPHELLPTAPPGPLGPEHLAREAFIDWCAVGLDLFLREGVALPSRRTIDDAAHRVMLLVVLRRHRSITAAANALETSRRALRDTMKRLGIYERWQRWQANARASAGGRSGASASASANADGQSRSTSTPEPARTVAPIDEKPIIPS